jgi:magnesium transporter
MQTGVLFATVDDDQEQTARELMEYDLLALPVVDAAGRLVGIVTHDDVIDVIVEEATEDVHRLGGIEPLEDSYLRTPFVTLWSKRGLWLAILFVAGFLTTSALAAYEGLFTKVPALVWFVPLIVSAGGNCGSQSATLITRALALGELSPSDWFRVLRHEILMGASLGLALGLIGFLRAILVPGELLVGIDPTNLAIVIAVGVAAVVVCGNLVGALLPLALKRAGLDPAYMSNPLVASLVDVTGILTYFAIAGAMLA